MHGEENQNLEIKGTKSSPRALLVPNADFETQEAEVLLGCGLVGQNMQEHCLHEERDQAERRIPSEC